jgi:hypothetical protein
MSVLEAFNHPSAVRYRDFHRTGRRREIDPCGTCNNFWPGFHGLSAFEAARTGIEYCTYIARHRPNGRRPPRASGAAASDGLVQLRTKHAQAGEAGSYRAVGD